MSSSESYPSKVLVSGELSSDGLALLGKSFDVHEYRQALLEPNLLEIIANFDALVVRSETKVTKVVLQAGRNLKVVARAGVGVDNIDVAEATKLGIVVVNSPSGNIGAAAEHTIALMMAMARRIPDALGLIVARLAKGLGMTVVAFDPYTSPTIAAAAGVRLVSLLTELLPIVDFLTIHTPLIASTRGMIGPTELEEMKPGSRILNVARGGTVDEGALLATLKSGHLAGAALDVFITEPPTADSVTAKLIAHPRVIATPHLGASTIEAEENVSIDVCEQVVDILVNGSLPRSAVNAPLILPEEYQKLQPFVRLVEKMGSLYTQHYDGRPGGFMNRNTFELTYKGDLASLTNTKPLFAAFIKGLLAPVSGSEGINVNIVNAEIVAHDRGIVVNEQRFREPNEDTSYSSLVTLVARPPSRASSLTRGAKNLLRSQDEGSSPRIISGTCSGDRPLITRLGKFEAQFEPEGNLLICEDNDLPGKVGVVGSILGQEGVNINFMTVSSESSDDETGSKVESRIADKDGSACYENEGPLLGSQRVLMILGIDREVSVHIMGEIARMLGVVTARVVKL
ncbi:hypothetical protein POX_a00945 [Penicillium oxalicum]|uniref:hypothetical protein n=1 Tax=Penicillium oxalicum TaxID=69781 RepID=UPI0020B74E98|nr:hypothetical protein POX_a00945 [Penicillium oxalicum]KAI2794347.1 hypothetical protein POX_a00945 [Penicillium oxalicum]